MSLTRIGSIGINTGIAFAGVTTIVTLNTANDALSIGATVNVGSGITLGASGDIFATGVTTATTFSGSGANLTNLPAANLTGTLPAISGANLTNLDASDLASGTVPTARLGSGTASSSTFLRGDSTFQTVNTDLVSDTSPQLGGNLDVNTKNIVFSDSSGASDDRLTFGAGTDLSIYHDGTYSNIYNNTDTTLRIINGGNAGMLIQNQNSHNIEIKTNAEDAIKCVANGAVELYFNNIEKFVTDSSGSVITGRLAFNNTGSSIQLADNQKATFGNGQDLQIFHDASQSIIRDAGTGSLILQGSQVIMESADGGEVLAKFIDDGAVELYHDNSKKVETNSTGINMVDKVIMFQGQGSRVIKYRDGENDMIYEGNSGFFMRQDIGNNRHEFFVGNSKKVSVTGNGLTFNSDTAAANALDDYEEGSFTPTMGSTNNAPSFSYSYQRGKYVKVGRQVTVWTFVYGTIGGTETGNLQLKGLPFTVRDEYAQMLSIDYGNWDGFPSGHAGMGGYAQLNDTYVQLISFGDKNSGAIHASNWGTNTYLYSTMSYMTDS